MNIAFNLAEASDINLIIQRSFKHFESSIGIHSKAEDGCE
jgi:hypothetical protein